MKENTDYLEFLKTKIKKHEDSGFTVDAESLNPMLFDFQKAIVRWALAKGRAAIFADCGLGKTPMQLEWARRVHQHTGGNILILAPLAVSQQTQREGVKFGIETHIAESQADIRRGIYITNYEKLHRFDAASFAGVVLDESSILKSISGKYKTHILESFDKTQYKLACTATPSPNDLTELGNHSQFLNVCSTTEMLSMFFYNDGGQTSKWHIKGHAEKEFWRWTSQWAVAISNPRDIGFPQEGFDLPELKIHRHIVESDLTENAADELFRRPELSSTAYHKEKRISAEDRADYCRELYDRISGDNQPVLIWCETNYDADVLRRVFPEAVEVRGSDKDLKKEAAAIDFQNGKIKILISKPSIFGFGLNFQNCHDVIFDGLSYSYESFYQATRRTWRYGQTQPVNVHVVIADAENGILGAIEEKEHIMQQLQRGMVESINEFSEINTNRKREKIFMNTKTESGENWKLINGDCCQETKTIPDESIHLSVFSPPFASLYTYSDLANDMGNSISDEQFFSHMSYLTEELLRITKPGRICAFHCMLLPSTMQHNGYIGLRDFRGDLIRMFVNAGWTFHSEVTIWKDPVTAMQRTKALGLLHKQLKKDSCRSRQGIPDYLVVMRKPGDNPEPVSHTNRDFPVEQWQEWASPVWMDIRPSNTLQKERDEKDEKHICPLQLDVIERCLVLWSNVEDTVFSPFAGIGSEGYVAIQKNRKFIGIELKEAYFNQAVSNLKEAERKLEIQRHDLFSMMAGGATE